MFKIVSLHSLVQLTTVCRVTLTKIYPWDPLHHAEPIWELLIAHAQSLTFRVPNQCSHPPCVVLPMIENVLLVQVSTIYFEIDEFSSAD